MITNGCDNSAGEEEGLAKTPGWNTHGSIPSNGYSSIIGIHNVRHELLQIVGLKDGTLIGNFVQEFVRLLQ